jgi:PAS domain S-box-containing protein
MTDAVTGIESGYPGNRMHRKIKEKLETWIGVNSPDQLMQQRGQILAILLFIFIISAMILSLLNLWDWIASDRGEMLRYSFLDLLIGILMVGLAILNRRGKNVLAAHICLNLIVFGTLALFELDKPNIWVSFLAIPIFISSFILAPISSFLYSTIATLGYSSFYLLIRPITPYPYITLLSFFIIAAVSYLIASRYNKASEQILHLDRQFHALFEHVPVGLYRTTPDGHILEANRTLVNMLGYPDQQSLMKIKTTELYADPSAFQEWSRPHPSEEDHLVIEARFRRQDGSIFWASDSTTAVYDEKGGVLYFEGCLIDIDQRKRTEEQVHQRAEQFASLYEVAQDLASHHDLQTLLNHIVDHAIGLVNVSGGGIYFYDARTDTLCVEVAKGMAGIQIGTTLTVNEGVAGRVARTHEALIVEDYQSWEYHSNQFEGLPIRGVLAVPMLYNGNLIGVLLVHEAAQDDHKFTSDDVHLLTLLAGQAAIAVNNARLYNDAMKRLEQLESMRTIEKVMSANTDMRLTLNATLSEAARQLNISALDILTVNPYKHVLEFSAGLGFRTPGIDKFSISLNDKNYRDLIEGRQTIKLHNLRETGNEIFQARQFGEEGFSCYLGIPLIIKGQVVGILEAFDRDHYERDDEWREFLDTLGQQAAIAIDNANLFEDLARSNTELSIAYETTLEGWSRALDLRDQETEGHTRRVTQMTVSLASFLGIRDYELLHIRRGALLHDIGKMGIPDEVLLKPGPFTDKDWSWMHKHPRLAYEMLYPIRYLHPALDIPYCHHERWDGTGYPQGLKGREIPLSARLFTVVDVWDAMTSDRPYRPALSRAEANTYLKEQSGKHFDPEAVSTFFKYYGEL